MKVREILLFKKENLADGARKLIGADQIRPRSRPDPTDKSDNRSPGTGGLGRNPAAANPDDVPGIEQPPQVGIKPTTLALIATPPRWDIDRIEPQVARLPRHHQVSRR
jgi:hypothetical protein